MQELADEPVSFSDSVVSASTLGEKLRWKFADATCVPCTLTASVNVSDAVPLQE